MFQGKVVDQFSKHNTVRLLNSGKPYFEALLDLIANAKNELHLQVYIFEPDETGELIKSALVEASLRGVNVFLLLDGFGSSSLTKKIISEMKTSGIHFRWFGPLLSGGRIHIGRRMHHKIAVADQRIAIVGGINIGNRYNEWNTTPPWYDFAVITEGEIAFKLHAYCAKKWKGFFILKRKNPEKDNSNSEIILPETTCNIRIRVNDALNRKSRIVYSYRKALLEAQKEVIIVGGYFLPGQRFIKLMRQAFERGVKIILITGSQSDVWVAQNALRYLYRKLLRTNIEIYEYTKAPVHGKVIVADKKFVSIGSYDLNQLSSFINLELNLDIDDITFGMTIHKQLEQTLHRDCIIINKSILQTREDALTMLKQWLSFRFLRLLFVLTLFVSNKKNY